MYYEKGANRRGISCLSYSASGRIIIAFLQLRLYLYFCYETRCFFNELQNATISAVHLSCSEDHLFETRPRCWTPNYFLYYFHAVQSVQCDTSPFTKPAPAVVCFVNGSKFVQFLLLHPNAELYFKTGHENFHFVIYNIMAYDAIHNLLKNCYVPPCLTLQDSALCLQVVCVGFI